MLMLLSPAKNLDFNPAPEALAPTKPGFSKDADALASVARDLTRAKLKSLMSISDALADLNYERFQAFSTRARKGTKPAALAFNGDVYLGLEAKTLDADDLAFAQDHLRILSGLYGLLRPLDAIMPYRLEMGSKLKNPVGEDLYDFWGDKIAKSLNKSAKPHADPTLVNLASKEYFSAVDLGALKLPVITPVFKEEKDGRLRQLQFFAKRARGLMARWAIQNRVEHAEALKKFSVDGYKFRASESDETTWLFARPQPPKKS
ncbi:MAG: peroxide stress protein YaaA [Pseudomonadota bacterium]